jgi:hypothetical protein
MIKLTITRNFKTKLPVYWPHIQQSQYGIPRWFVAMNYKYCWDTGLQGDCNVQNFRTKSGQQPGEGFNVKMNRLTATSWRWKFPGFPKILTSVIITHEYKQKSYKLFWMSEEYWSACDFRLSQQCKWHPHSSRILCSAFWWFVTDISDKSTSPIIMGQADPKHW